VRSLSEALGVPEANRQALVCAALTPKASDEMSTHRVTVRGSLGAPRHKVASERRCEKSSRLVSEPGEHDADHGQADECLAAGGQNLVVFAQPTGEVQPADSPLDVSPNTQRRPLADTSKAATGGAGRKLVEEGSTSVAKKLGQ
jgi:hypothetical protein